MVYLCFFFFNDTATTEIYTLSLHDALPICSGFLAVFLAGLALGTAAIPAKQTVTAFHDGLAWVAQLSMFVALGDRKSTRLNSSHANISYAVFCLKKKKKQIYKYTDNIMRSY